jgi:hypothetical protein
MDSVSHGRTPSFGNGPLILVGWEGKDDQVAVPEGTTMVDYPGLERDMMIRYDQDTIQIKKGSQDKFVTIQKNGDTIEIHKHGASDADCRIVRSGDDIRIDRPGVSDDVTISRRGGQVIIDREGLDNDAKISSTKGGSMMYPCYITFDGEIIEQF